MDPQLAEILAIVKGARNGFTYGAKIRFPHALVYVNPMTYSFPSREEIGIADHSDEQYGLLISVWNVRLANFNNGCNDC